LFSAAASLPTQGKHLAYSQAVPVAPRRTGGAEPQALTPRAVRHQHPLLQGSARRVRSACRGAAEHVPNTVREHVEPG
jgi:hypothetical protein